MDQIQATKEKKINSHLNLIQMLLLDWKWIQLMGCSSLTVATGLLADESIPISS